VSGRRDIAAKPDDMSTALGLEITIDQRRIVQSNFHQYPWLRMKDASDV
jgi:CO/xanthine dehydrogenase Mo-binding subunit